MGRPKCSKSQEALRSHSTTARISWSPPKEALLREVQKMLCHAWVKTAAPSHSLGVELQVRLAVTLILPSSQIWAVPASESPLQFTLSFCAGMCPGPTQKCMLHFSVCRNWFSKPWTGLASHWGCLSYSATPSAVCYHTCSCTGRAVIVCPLSSTSSKVPPV